MASRPQQQKAPSQSAVEAIRGNSYRSRKGSLAGSFLVLNITNMDEEIDFTRRLIKGKIAEIIFEMMIREMDRVTVLRAGYEYTHPEIAQYQQLLKGKGREVLKFFEHNPDFLLFNKNKSSLYLVEVKYSHDLNFDRVYRIAKEELERSDYIWLFVATPLGFFFSQCKDIVRTNNIQPLSPDWVLPDIQRNHLALLNEFLCR